ncbi:relaxase/mobilization nuclease domain-containing protein [Variovorax sp. J22R115]|nr:relaxase/mobilization nuclease domain-containing protein [Variovorax sp. J22R115]MDM0052979.1 relaxase/mobilization nuclease domain-containing protein [Variovorax sp. J22R115]
MELDIVSYGRRGPGARATLSVEQIEQVKRTVGRAAEVLVKVSGGARDTGAARAHLKYIDRHGKLQVETDEGVTLQGRTVADGLIADWQLDLCRSHYMAKPAAGAKDLRAKLVHHIVLSMPAGTPPQKVLNAARSFARENFALQYRYAMVLHTDQAHPHVHLVVKCNHEFEPGRRLYVRKDTLRAWREQFAALMREEGVAANATPRQLRGARKGFKDPIHHRLRELRVSKDARNETVERAPVVSSFMRGRLQTVAEEIQKGGAVWEGGRGRLLATRSQVVAAWRLVAGKLRSQGDLQLASEVDRFVFSLPSPATDREDLKARLLAHLNDRRRAAASVERTAEIPPRNVNAR